jgi:hypothetical protein
MPATEPSFQPTYAPPQHYPTIRATATPVVAVPAAAARPDYLGLRLPASDAPGGQIGFALAVWPLRLTAHLLLWATSTPGRFVLTLLACLSTFAVLFFHH